MFRLNDFLSVALIMASIFGGGVSAFFIIRSQLLTITKSTLEATVGELDVYKNKVDRLDKDLKILTQTLGIVKTENLALITERNYLRGLIIAAITSQKDIHKELIDEIKNSDSKLNLYSEQENESKV